MHDATDLLRLCGRHGRAFTGRQGDLIPDADIERVGEARLQNRAAVAYPVASGQLGLVDRGWRRVAPHRPHPGGTFDDLSPRCAPRPGDAVSRELRPGHNRVRPAVVGDAGIVGECLQAGAIGGLADEGVGGGAGDDIGPSGCLPGVLVGVVGHPAQGEPRASGWWWRPSSRGEGVRPLPDVAAGSVRRAGPRPARGPWLSCPVRPGRRAGRSYRRSTWSRRRTHRRASRSSGLRSLQCACRG